MTNEKDQLQQELQEKIQAGIKPSDIKKLKRSKSVGDIPSPSPSNSELIVGQKENQELKQKISQLEDRILELRLDKLKEFGQYQEEKKELEKELQANVDHGVQEIEKLETKLRTLHKKKLALQQQLGEAQSKNAQLEIKLINTENKEPKPITPDSDFWTDYGPIISYALVYLLFIWLLSKNQQKQ